MIRVGVTGGLGSGKTTVLAMLAERGAATLSADDIAKEMIAVGGPAHAPVAARFPDCVRRDGSLDNKRLASKVFGDARSLAWLNGLVHPLVARRLEELLTAMDKDGTKVAVVEVPLLLEAGFARQFDLVVAVSSPEETRLARLIDAGWNAADARRRIAAQALDSERASIADVVIDNSGNARQLSKAVADLWQRIAKEAR